MAFASIKNVKEERAFKAGAASRNLDSDASLLVYLKHANVQPKD